MQSSIADTLRAELQRWDRADADFATRTVDLMLTAARQSGASDLHLQPAPDGLELKFRIDGVLQPVARFPAEVTVNVVARLKVLSGLLTYHTDRPQEGRIRVPDGDIEMRVSTFPTLHGERAVVRLFGSSQQFQKLDDLGLPGDVLQPLRRLLGETSGAILVSGPAGSGKTTTVYACLRELAGGSDGNRSLVSIEDPIEVAVPGVAQTQINAMVGLDLATGLRCLMRQDPEVIMVGEIRDRAAAEAAMQASLTGHLLLSTFHAGSAAETLGRLLDMGIEPYVARSGLLAILSQRLARRLCRCARPSEDVADRLGLPVQRAMVPVGCPACGGTGYRGRLLLVEMLLLKADGRGKNGDSPAGHSTAVASSSQAELGRAILARADAPALDALAVRSGMIGRWRRACQAVEAGHTSPAEIRRVLGFAS